MKRARFLLLIAAVWMLFPIGARAASFSARDDGELSYFSETFSERYIRYDEIVDKYGKAVWQITASTGKIRSITDTGALQLGDERYMQRAVLGREYWDNRQDYAMEFTVNVQKVGNEGNENRPIVMVIPRSKDLQFKEYYAVTYYMENTVANQFKFKWAVINTAAPTGMSPLAEGYSLMQENVDYTGRLVIKNTEDGNVNLKFYLDGPTSPMTEYKPLLEYTDSSEYKITTGMTGPAFGTVGYSDSGWGTSPVVRYDNIRLYDPDGFARYEETLSSYASADAKDVTDPKAYGQIKYLMNRGIVSGYPGGLFKPDESVSVAQFAKMLMAAKGETVSPGGSDWLAETVKKAEELGIVKGNEFSDYSRPITKYEAALMIARINGSPIKDSEYSYYIRDYASIPVPYQFAALYAYYEGYFRLDDSFLFKGSAKISRAEAAAVCLRVLDAGYRKINYDLELPSVLSSGAVFQGNKKIPVWGRGFCGETVTVTFGSQIRTAVVKNGYWYLELEPMKYGGPYYLTVRNSRQTIVVNDITVGEVFLVAGQSNAEMFLSECDDAFQTVMKFKDKPNLRFFSGEQITAVTPNFTSVGNWEKASQWALNESPAIGAFFAENLLELNPDLKDVTIGIIRLTYGGTTVEAFMPRCIDEENGYVPQDDQPIMSGFWNGFMEPVAPFAVRGVMYYQGENSAQLGYRYEPLLRDYLRGIRTEFKDPNLPVMLVQLAGYGYNNYETDINEWPKIRDVQMKVAESTPNTGLVTAVDLSDADPIEIHPKNKKEVGRRLAHLAMGLIYGKEIEQRSAELKSCVLEGNKITVGFNYDFGKIYKKENITDDFQVLDTKGKWHEAKAEVKEDNTVEIQSDEVAAPIGVRYAWVNYPSVSLYNNVDLPVLPFKVVDLNETTENVVKLEDHLMRSDDAIVNTTRGSQFRVVMVMDENTLTHEFSIKGQTAGDQIERLSRQGNAKTGAGTTETVVKLHNHGLSAGDWIRNDTRGWTPARVIRVIDKDTIEVAAIKGQTAGDEIDIYRLAGESAAK